MFCEKHQLQHEWVVIRPGLKRCVCAVCHEQQMKDELNAKHLPLVRYSQTFHRIRPLTDKEKRFKPRKPT